MDPDAALDELLALTDAPLDLAEFTVWPLLDLTEIARVAELVHALDGWLLVGGFLPRRWAAGRKPR